MPAFDAHRAPEQSIIDDCVHCGFCLDSCPTYVLWAEEADSPRGRIVLMDEALEQPSLSEEMVSHFDRCLGCMACVSACPSGVRYDRLIERTRPQVERNYERARAERALRRLLFETLPHPRRLRALAPLLPPARSIPDGLIPDRLSLLAKIAPRRGAHADRRLRVPRVTAAHGEPRGRVALLLGCVQRVFFPHVHQATVGVLAAEGFEVLAPAAPDCCGALEFHAGEEQAAADRARETIAELGDVDYVVVNSAGCGSAMKEYGELLETSEARAFSAKVRDVSELLDAAPSRARRGPIAIRVAYHDACHLAHAQQIRDQPRALLSAIPELELLEVPFEREICCGSAGIYNLVQPQAAAELGERKARNLINTGADAIAAANPGCTAQLDLHLRELGHPLPIHHPIELVWRSIEANR